jgi:hypothetical protein
LATTSLAAAKQHNVGGKNFDLATGLAFLFPSVLTQLAFDPNLLALDEILVDCFGRFSPKGDVEKVGFFHPLIVLFSSLVDGDAEFADRGAAVGVLQLGVPGQTAHENDMIYVSHTFSLGS